MGKKSITINQYNIIGKRVDVDFNKISQEQDLEEILVKNFEIKNEFIEIINSLKKLKRIWFVNCEFNFDIELKNIEILDIEMSSNVIKNLFCKNIKYLYLRNSGYINLDQLKEMDLITLCVEKENVSNLRTNRKF